MSGSLFSIPRFICLVVMVLLAAAAAHGQPTERNFVFFLVDDLGWRDLASYGSSFYETPNVDRLVASGMRFTQGYAAGPVCSPTRASIMTGKYPVRTRITDYINPQGRNQPSSWSRNTRLLPAPYQDRLALEEVTLAEALKQSGYATFYAGKWHLGPQGFWPEDQGFDVNKGGTEQGGPYGGAKYFSPYGNPRLEDGPPGEHLPNRLAEETVRFIEANREGRFLAYLSFYSVHTPLMARKDLEEKYRRKAELIQFSGPRFVPEGFGEARQVQDHAIYGGMVEAMDSAVGKVLDALDRLRLDEKTVVIFTSDNGGLSTSEGLPTANIPLRAGKGWLYEGGVREPMVIRAPAVTEPGSVCTQPVMSTDFYPTVLELAGIALRPNRHQDGVSLVGLLRGLRPELRSLFWHYPHYGNQGGRPSGAVREGDWKLIEWYEDGQLELYNIRHDLSERYNLASLLPEKARELLGKLSAWREELGAVQPSPNPTYRPQ